VALEKKLEEIARLDLRAKEMGSKRLKLRNEAQTIFREVKAPLFAELSEAQDSSRLLREVGVVVTLKTAPGKPRTVNQAFVAEKLPLLIQEFFPSLQKSLSKQEYENSTKALVDMLYAPEFRGINPPVNSITVKKLSGS
jgi:hypothetical protein